MCVSVYVPIHKSHCKNQKAYISTLPFSGRSKELLAQSLRGSFYYKHESGMFFLKKSKI